MGKQGRIRLAFVGGVHPHFRWLLDSALQSPTANVVGISVGDTELCAHFAAKHPALAVFADAGELYDKARPQAIVSCSDNRRAAQDVLDAAVLGVHAMKEKPMAASLALAEEMRLLLTDTAYAS